MPSSTTKWYGQRYNGVFIKETSNSNYKMEMVSCAMTHSFKECQLHTNKKEMVCVVRSHQNYIGAYLNNKMEITNSAMALSSIYRASTLFQNKNVNSSITFVLFY